MSCTKKISLQVNGREMELEIPVHINALTMIRDYLHLSGTKLGCGEGECGACTILVDGQSVNACLSFAVDLDGREMTTIEGLQGQDCLDTLQETFIGEGAVQCGFCTPGMIMQGTHILKNNPTANTEEIKRGIEGNLCRCTGYKKIVDAIASAVHNTQSIGT